MFSKLFTLSIVMVQANIGPPVNWSDAGNQVSTSKESSHVMAQSPIPLMMTSQSLDKSHATSGPHLGPTETVTLHSNLNTSHTFQWALMIFMSGELCHPLSCARPSCDVVNHSMFELPRLWGMWVPMWPILALEPVKLVVYCIYTCSIPGTRKPYSFPDSLAIHGWQILFISHPV